MGSHIYDILALCAAVLIVIVLATVVKPMLYGQAVVSPVSMQPSSQIQTSDSGVITAESIIPAGSEVKYVVSNYSSYVTTKTEQKDMLAKRIAASMDYYMPSVRVFASHYIAENHMGNYNPAQVCDIFESAKADWTYVRDPDGIVDITPATTLINTGLEGDSNDFAVFIASLIKSAGGQARIKTDRGNTAEGSVFAEVYIGNSATMEKTIVNQSALAEMKAEYPFVFKNDPYGANFFKKEYVETCGDGECVSYMHPLAAVISDPERYCGMLYEYPGLIEYIMKYPETSMIDFYINYLKYRYGYHDTLTGRTNPLKEVYYSYSYEPNGEKSYWIGLGYNMRYPGDMVSSSLGYATVYYSDGSYDDVRFSNICP